MWFVDHPIWLYQHDQSLTSPGGVVDRPIWLVRGRSSCLAAGYRGGEGLRVLILDWLQLGPRVSYENEYRVPTYIEYSTYFFVSS
jgi:hypothetical protein